MVGVIVSQEERVTLGAEHLQVWGEVGGTGGGWGDVDIVIILAVVDLVNL